MEKLPMCRICLVKNVSMYAVVNSNLHELYEKLTDIPFVTEDSRPIFACFFCFAKLKHCYRFLRKCLEAEKLFARMMNEDYEPNTKINHDHLEFYSEFIKSPTENISIVDECQTESIAIKEELPAVCEGLDDIIEPKEELESDELELENFDNSCLDVPLHYSDSDDDVPLMEFKIKVDEEQKVSMKEQRTKGRKSATVAKKPKLETRRTNQEDSITAERTKKEQSDSKVIRTTQKRTSKPGTYFKEPYNCDHRNFNRLKINIQKTRTQIGEKFKCDVCQRSFSQKGNLKTHIRIHTGEKPYKCDICQRSFIEKDHLKRHIRIHTGEKPYKCNVCQRSFSIKSNLSNHILIHTGEKPYKCDVCQRRFNHKGDFNKHIRIHTGEKPYKCDVCQRSFSVKVHLKRHIRIHTGEKPYKCNVCQRSFSIKSNLSKHILIHTGEKPYKCDVCQRGFSQKGNLSQHIRIHTGEKPYKCDVCQRRFRIKYNLSTHIRIHTQKSDLTYHSNAQWRKTINLIMSV